MSILDPFTEDERYMLAHAFKTLHDTDFFGRLAIQQSLEAINRFDSLTPAGKVDEMNRLSGTRSTLLYLAMESQRIAVELRKDSTSEEPGDSANEYDEEPLFTDHGA